MRSIGKRDATPSFPNGILKIYNALSYPSVHPQAFADENGRAVRATTQSGFLVFGQYEKNFPTQDLVAVYSIMVDNNTADDAHVCLLDVVENMNRVTAKSPITRKDFPEAGKHVRFTLPFKSSSTDTTLEFRLFYMGYTYMAIKGIYVIDPAIITVESLPPDDELLALVAPPPVVEIPQPGGEPVEGTRVYDLKVSGGSIFNGTQKLVITGWSTYMWKDMKSYPWDGKYKGKSPQEFADIMVKYNANLTRTFCIDTWSSALFPWKKEGNKFDLNRFDPTYMANLRNLITAFGNKGIIVQLDLFDNVALWDHNDGMTWTRHPFNAANGGPISNSKDGRPDFYNPNANVKALQEKYIRYMVSSLKDLKNVVFEVCNEYNGGANWHNWVADVIKSENSSILVSASAEINSSAADQIFKHKNINITSSHANEWVTGDLKNINQGVLNRLKGYGKPTLLSTDGSKENWGAMKNDMINSSKTVISQGFGIEFKELVESVAQAIAALSTPIPVTTESGTTPKPEIPTTTPQPSDFCKGGEIVCIDGFDQAKVDAAKGKNWGGGFANGTYRPANRGGLEFKFSLDTGKPYTIEIHLEGGIANFNKPDETGGKANVLSILEPNGPFWFTFQRKGNDYRGIGRFRIMMSVGKESDGVILITTPDLSGDYSMANWGNEPHKLRVEVNGSRCRLLIDNTYTSKWAQASKPISGVRSVSLMLGNGPASERYPGQEANTQFRRFKIYY
jgi:hypothetical protein